MSDDEARDLGDESDEGTWPVKGPATPRQALFSIAFLCFVCLVIGFVLGRTL